MSETTAKATAAARYSKDKFLAGKAYQGQRDLLSALLEDGQTYTKAEVDKLIKNYLKKGVR